jgi:hypothetical protein
MCILVYYMYLYLRGIGVEITEDVNMYPSGESVKHTFTSTL